MAAPGHFARKATDNLSVEAKRIMRLGFQAKKTSAEIAHEIASTTGEQVNPRTIGRRAHEFRQHMEQIREDREQVEALVAAVKEGNLEASDIITAMAMTDMMQNRERFAKQNPVKVQAQALKAEEIALKREALRLKGREVSVLEERLSLLQLREQRAIDAVRDLSAKAARSLAITPDDMARVREIYGLGSEASPAPS